MSKIVVGIVVTVFVIIGLVTFSFDGKEINKAAGDPELNYEVSKKWDLPEILDEISGMEWIGDGKIACIQDEDGEIFIFDLRKGKIEDRISFGENGDYEGVSIHNENAYVLRSDGVIFEVLKYRSSNPETLKYPSNLKSDVNFEGICLDKENNRMLLIMKEEYEDKNTRDIYGFDLKTKRITSNPVHQIELDDDFFKNEKRSLKPSEIEWNPKTGEYYILDAKAPKLVIFDKDFKPKTIYRFKEKEFSQPEGIGFSPAGELYISNEAGKEAANILQVKLN